MRRPPPDDPPPSPWQRGTDIRGLVPPGRRLGAPDDRRASRWSASGVQGVVPPGVASPAPLSSSGARRASVRRARIGGFDSRSQASRGVERGRATPARDPDDLATFLETLSGFLVARSTPASFAESFHERIHRTRAPFELVVAFTVLSALVGESPTLRRRYALALERGARGFYNLARRIDPEVSVPRGLEPEILDALFHDLPDISLEVPYAAATDAFCRQIDLLREHDPIRDHELGEVAVLLRQRFIDRRTFGDRPLRDVFPWTLPGWAARESG